MNTVAIPFVKVAHDQNPNSRAGTDEQSLRSYLRAAFISLATFRRWNPELRLEFITNVDPPAYFVTWLKSIEASVRLVEFDHRPPQGFAKSFLGCFFLLDALSQHCDGTILLVDPDVVCLGNLEPVFERCRDAVGVLEMEYADSQSVNGLSRVRAQLLHKQLGEGDGPPPHFGGEIYVVPPSARRKLAKRAETAWSFSLKAFAEGRDYMPTEEHILNFAVRGVDHVLLNDLAKRVWTAHSFRTVDGRESDLLMWHLPAEKDRGFINLESAAADRASWFWRSAAPSFAARMGQVFGLWRRSPLRYAFDSAGRIQRAIRGVAR